MAKKTEKKRLGRPKSAESRDQYITGVRVSASEMAAIRVVAKARGMRLSEHVRCCLGLPATGYGREPA